MGQVDRITEAGNNTWNVTVQLQTSYSGAFTNTGSLELLNHRVFSALATITTTAVAADVVMRDT